MDKARPVVLAETGAADGTVKLRLFVPPELSLFAGHFPAYPLLPGVAQIHWAATFGAARFAIPGAFSRLLNVKFQKPVRPGDALELTLAWDSARRQLAFTYTSERGAHASGKLEFAAPGDNT